MYKFKQIKARYSFVSEVIKPCGERSVYSKIEQIEALSNWGEGLVFCLKGSTSERINGEELAGFDAITLKQGQSLYPIELNVLKTGEIKRVKNFPEIQKRWDKKCKSMLATYKNAYWVRRYINITSRNISSEVAFLEALCQNNFIQLFFMEEGAVKQRIELCIYPFVDKYFCVEFNLTSSNETEYHYKSEIGNIDEKICSGYGMLGIRYTEKGQPEHIQFLYQVEVFGKGFYSKKIIIKLTADK